MMQQRIGLPLSQENPLWISWHDSNWIPIVNPTNVMEYFSEKSNPFYDRTSNNEVVRMQRQTVDQLNNMTGVEYILLHVQDPILYVIRKQHRHTPTDATPMADYYIIAGIVYQAPDLASVLNSRLVWGLNQLSTVHHLQCAFEETSSYSRYHPSRGYSWDFSSNKALTDKSKAQNKKENEKIKEEPSSLFQKQRVDMLLGELLRKYPLPSPTSINQNQAAIQNATSTQNGTSNTNTDATDVKPDITTIKQEPIDTLTNGTNNENGTLVDGKEIKVEIKSEMKPPPEKKIKLQ